MGDLAVKMGRRRSGEWGRGKRVEEERGDGRGENGDRAKKRGGGGRQAVSSCLAARLVPSLQPRPTPPKPTWSRPAGQIGVGPTRSNSDPFKLS